MHTESDRLLITTLEKLAESVLRGTQPQAHSPPNQAFDVPNPAVSLTGYLLLSNP